MDMVVDKVTLVIMDSALRPSCRPMPRSQWRPVQQEAAATPITITITAVGVADEMVEVVMVVVDAMVVDEVDAILIIIIIITTTIRTMVVEVVVDGMVVVVVVVVAILTTWI
jgi:hypothetical protein